MDQTIIQYFISQGPFAVLFLVLLYWVLKKNDEREDRLISSLDKITERLNQMGEQVAILSRDISEIKDKIGG